MEIEGAGWRMDGGGWRVKGEEVSFCTLTIRHTQALLDGCARQWLQLACVRKPSPTNRSGLSSSRPRPRTLSALAASGNTPAIPTIVAS